MTDMVPISTADVARARVNKIRATMENVKELIVTAYKAKDWAALGYANWDTYCREEFGGTIVIPKQDRGDVVVTLREAGMSVRAIASATNIGKSTVDRTLTAVPSGTREQLATIVGLDGKAYQAKSTIPVEEAPEPTSTPDHSDERWDQVQSIIKERLAAEAERMQSVQRPAALKATRHRLPTEWIRDQMMSITLMASCLIEDGDLAIPPRNGRQPGTRNWTQLVEFYMSNADPLILAEYIDDLELAIVALADFKDKLLDFCGERCIDPRRSMS